MATTINWSGLMNLLDEIQGRLTKIEARLAKLEKKTIKKKGEPSES